MRRALSVTMALAFAATACGGSGTSTALEAAIKAETGQSVDFQQNGESFAIEAGGQTITASDDGSSTVITGTDADGNSYSMKSGTDVPGDFPLPVPDNIEVSSAITTETVDATNWQLTFCFDPSRVDEIVALYSDQFDNSGLSVESDSSGINVSGTTLVGTSDTVYAIVAVTDLGDDWQASIS